jgi:Family of unknown function (DUF5695)
LNGMALLQAYEDNGDPDALLKGYAGVMSVMANILPDGMGYNFFICTPGVFDHQPPRTFESGPGLWGFLRSAKSYVVKDLSFGEVGFGCQVDATEKTTSVHPRDGVRQRVHFSETGVDIAVAQGQISAMSVDRDSRFLRLQIGDSAGFAKKAEISIRGLPRGGLQDQILRLHPCGAFRNELGLYGSHGCCRAH